MRMLLVPLLLALVVAPAAGQDKTTFAALAPLYTDDGVVFVRVDTTKIDAIQAEKWFNSALKLDEDPAGRAENIKPVTNMEKIFRDAGGREVIWAVYPTVAFRGPNGTFAIAMLAKEGRAAELATAMSKALEPMPPNMELKATESGLILAYADQLEGEAMPAAVAKTLAAAFDAVKGSAVQVVFIPGEGTRRLIGDNVPTLPPEFGSISGEKLNEWISWAALSADLSPKPKIRLTIQSPSADAATSLSTSVTKLLETGATLPIVTERLPSAKEIAAFLKPQAVKDRVVITLGEKPGDLEVVAQVVGQPIKAARSAAKASQQNNALKQILLAMHNYHDVNGKFPPGASLGKDGKKLLSWRVHILPYIEEKELYDEFHLDEPWDSEHNRKLIDKMPRLYGSARAPLKEKGTTPWVAPIMEKSIFARKDAATFASISDGTSNTILFLEADPEHAVTWTKPDDLAIDAEKPTSGLQLDPRKMFLVGFADGSVRTIPGTIDPKVLKALITMDGGEVVAGP